MRGRNCNPDDPLASMLDFNSKNLKSPLAEKLRPQSLNQVVGQDHLISEGGPIGQMLNTGQLSSMILWGPPGCGKTTLARLLAQKTSIAFHPLSAVFSGVKDLRQVFHTAKMDLTEGITTLLFIDEIHRFNRAQQDAFLPYMEDGTIILVGATTENPSFELNSALLSRCQVFQLNPLDEVALQQLIDKVENKYHPLPINKKAKEMLIQMADGDGRYLLNLIESLLLQDSDQILKPQELTQFLQKKAPLYDKGQDNHYNLISALHKSVRSSDTDAALYWFSRMIDSGEDPNYIARRMVRMAVEDIGLADPGSIIQANTAWDTYKRLGSPEGELALAQCLIYLSTAPKSNTAYIAYKKAMQSAKNNSSLTPPKHILNAPTALMKDIGYGKGYVYDHDVEGGCSGQNCFPDKMKREQYYTPKEQGFEREILKRVNYWKKMRTRVED